MRRETSITASAKFWDRIAERYARRPVADEAAYQKKLEITRGYFRPDMRVLEFGCGTGSTAIAHASYVASILAIDVSSKMLEIATRKAAAANVDNVKFQRSSIEEFDADSTFDVVLGLSILHLVEDRDDVCEKVYKLLEPGGLFVTSTTCIGDTLKLFKLIVPIGRLLGRMPYVDVCTSAELKQSLTGAGFEIDYEWQPGKRAALFIVARRPHS